MSGQGGPVRRHKLLLKYSTVQSVQHSGNTSLGHGSPHLARGFCGPVEGGMTGAVQYSVNSNVYHSLEVWVKLVLWWYCEQSHQKPMYKQVYVLPSVLVCLHSWTNPLNRLIYFEKWVSFQICQHHDMSPLRRIGPLIPKMKLLHPYDTSFLPQANLYSLECAKMMAILRNQPI